MPLLTRKSHRSGLPVGTLLLGTIAAGAAAFWLDSRRREQAIDERTRARLLPRKGEQG